MRFPYTSELRSVAPPVMYTPVPPGDQTLLVFEDTTILSATPPFM